MNDKIGHFCTKVDTLITVKPVKLKSVIITPDDSTVADVVLYNGRDTNGESLGTFRTGSGITLPVNFSDGVSCDRGIYLDVGSHVASVLVIWEYID